MNVNSNRNTKRSKLAIVVQKYGLVGGGEKFVFELSERLALDGRWDIHVFANQWRKGTDLIQFHHVPIFSFPRFLKPLSFAHFANRRISAAEMDLIHTHERIFYADLLTAHGIPHAIWAREVRQKRLSLFDRATAVIEKQLVTSTRCRGILAVSSLVEVKMITAFPEVENKIRTITPGVDITPYDESNRGEWRARIRKQFGFSDTDRVILFVGMNYAIKGLEAIIAAVAGLKKIAPDMTTKLLVIGKGDTTRYKGIARQNGIEKEIVFAGVWRDEIAPVYMAADLFAMLSAFDTFGLAVLEAMAAGLPVIISPKVGARDVIRNGENGFIVDPGNIDEVSRCMARALSQKENKRMMRYARQTAEAHTWSAMAEQVAEIYENILNANPP